MDVNKIGGGNRSSQSSNQSAFSSILNALSANEKNATGPMVSGNDALPSGNPKTYSSLNTSSVNSSSNSRIAIDRGGSSSVEKNARNIVNGQARQANGKAFMSLAIKSSKEFLAGAKQLLQ
jgi:hypothetical protein